MSANSAVSTHKLNSKILGDQDKSCALCVYCLVDRPLMAICMGDMHRRLHQCCPQLCRHCTVAEQPLLSVLAVTRTRSSTLPRQHARTEVACQSRAVPAWHEGHVMLDAPRVGHISGCTCHSSPHLAWGDAYRNLYRHGPTTLTARLNGVLSEQRCANCARHPLDTCVRSTKRAPEN